LLCRRWEEEEEEVLDVGGGSDKKCAFDMKTKEREMGIIKRGGFGLWRWKLEGRLHVNQTSSHRIFPFFLPSILSFSISYCHIRVRS
jgi:hypothetical protein